MLHRPGDGAENEILQRTARTASAGLGAVAIEAGGVGAGTAEVDEGGAEGGAGAMKRDAGVVRGEAEGEGGGGNGLALEFDEAEEGGVVGFQGRQEIFETGAEVAVGFTVVGREGGGGGGPDVVAAAGGAAAASVVDDLVAENLIEPGSELGVVAELVGVLEGFEQAALEEVVSIGLVAHAGNEKGFERAAMGQQHAGDLGRGGRSGRRHERTLRGFFAA